jgi:hypothetical protein
MKAHAALTDEFGATPWWHGGGSLEWEAEPDRTAQRENIEQLRSWGYAAEWLTSRSTLRIFRAEAATQWRIAVAAV